MRSMYFGLKQKERKKEKRPFADGRLEWLENWMMKTVMDAMITTVLSVARVTWYVL
jgi:hypothetical protein